MERNTRIRASQIVSIKPNDIEASNSVQDNYYIRKKVGEDKFEWIAITNTLAELDDVNFDSGTPIDNQILIYDSASSKWKAEIQQASQVDIAYLNSPTYTTLQDLINTLRSAGVISGGAFSDNGNGTLAVASGTGLIKIENTLNASCKSFDWVEDTNVSLIDETVNYIMIDYNSGTPQIISSDTDTSNGRTIFKLGIVYREGTVAHLFENGIKLSEWEKDDTLYHQEIDGVVLASGGIPGETGTRNITVTSAILYSAHKRFPTSAFNSSLSGSDFEYYYYDGDASGGGRWVETHETQIDNVYYNDISTGLEELTSNRYGVHWVYLCNDGDVLIVYGQANYITLTQAQNSIPPTNLPGHITDFSSIIGRIIIQKNSSTFTEIDILIEKIFSTSGIIYHNELANIQGGQASEYYHLKNAEHTELTQWLDNVTLGSDGKLTLPNGVAIDEFSNDETLAGDSDLAVPTEKAVKKYVDDHSGGANNLTDLLDVDFDSGTPIDNDVLTYDEASGKWKAEPSSGGGASQLSDLSDVGVTTPTNRNVLVANGGSFESRALVEDDISNLDHYDSSNFDTDFAGKDLDDLSDGSVYKRLKVDDFTIKENSNIIKIADRIENNIMLNAFRIAVNGSLVQFNMQDGVSDEYEDESGIDTGASSNEDYDSGNNLYKPTTDLDEELDYMEYSTDELARASWISSDPTVLGSGIDENTVLMLHMNGANEGTTFTDSSPSAHGDASVTATVQTKTDVKKWGTASALFDGNSGYLSYADNDDWNVLASNSDDWTIDLWVKHTTHADEDGYISHYEDKDNMWKFVHTDAFGLRFIMLSGGAWDIDFKGGKIEDSEWHHVCLVKKANEYGLYLDGTQTAYLLDSDTDTFTGSLLIGLAYNTAGSPTFRMDGYMDEIRIQHSNIFDANPNDTPNDTIDIPTGEYAGLIEGSLVVSSEDEIKNQGSYSLKSIADITDSLNETITKTLGSGEHLDLTSYDEIKFDVYASRTGTNLRLKIHDSGGTTSTKDIIVSSANEWETITWDISGISSANKDDIDSIVVEIINADAENTFYIDNMYAVGKAQNMILISESFVAEATPSTARIVLFEENVDAITLNTDLKAYISRDGGSTWAQVTLTDEGNYESSKQILAGIVDLTQSGIGSGTNIKYKIETLNNKSLKLHGTGVIWN